MLRTLVFVSVVVIVGAIVNFAVHARYRLSTPSAVTISTVGLMCHDDDACVSAIAYDAHDGNIYATENQNQRIIRISPSGKLSLVAGVPYDEWPVAGTLACLNRDGLGLAARFCDPTKIAYNAVDHSLVIADTENNAVRKMTEDGRVSTVSSSGSSARCWDFTFALSHVCKPQDIAVDPLRGTMFVAQGSAVMQISNERHVAILAGSDPIGVGSTGCMGRGGKSMNAVYCAVSGIAVDKRGTVHVAEEFDNVIDAIQPAGASEIEAGTRESELASGYTRQYRVGVPLFYLVSLLLPQTQGENVRNWAIGCPAKDGSNLSAQFCEPRGISADQVSGILYIAESGAIRQIDQRSGRVSSVSNVADNNETCAPVDGDGQSARICDLVALAVDSRNHLLYIADGSRLRKITLP